MFDQHGFNDSVYAVERSFALFKNNEKYELCRVNAFNSAIDIMDVAKNCCKEFYRLRSKVRIFIYFRCSLKLLKLKILPVKT